MVDKGHTVVDFASCRGLGEGVLYKWVRKPKAVDGVPLGDMRPMHDEVAKLKAELRRTTLERGILKRPQRISQNSLGEVRVHLSPPIRIQTHKHVPSPQG